MENQRVALTKRLIKESLVKQLATQSIHKISIRALCEGAGINRTTFYKYYGSQYDVLAALEEDFLGGIRQNLEQRLIVSPDDRYMEGICYYLEEHIELAGLLLSNNVDPEFPDKLFQMPLIQQLVQQVLQSEYPLHQRQLVFGFVANGCYQLLKNWIDDEARCSAEEIAGLLTDLIEKLFGKSVLVS